MSLLRRIAQAQKTADGQPTESLTPVPYEGVRRASSVGREQQLREIRDAMQTDVIANSHELFSAANDEQLHERIAGVVDRMLAENSFAVTREERLRLIDEVVSEVTGLGPLEPLLRDDSITEIMVNGPNQIYIERRGKIERVNTTFMGNEHVLRIIDRIIAPLGRRIDQSSPRVDARLADGSRVNAIIEPLSLIGPVITIRKFSARPFTVDDLIKFGTASPDMFEFLRCCVEARLNIFVSGGTGSGKTTTLNVLSSFIPDGERIVTIEDAAELQLRQEHVVTLEARPPNLEGLGEITTRDLLRNALHMRPDRIIVGECRGGEALDMIQAMTVGQEGSLSTGHANSSPDMLRRLETMILMSGYELPLRTIREQIASAVDLIVHTARLKDGTRKVLNITEVYGVEDDQLLTQDIFSFEQTGIDENGKIVGDLRPTGERPTFMPKFHASGIELPPGEYGIPPEDDAHPVKIRVGKGRSIGIDTSGDGRRRLDFGLGTAHQAGGMVYVSSVGPVVPDTGRLVSDSIKDQGKQCMANLKGLLEREGTSLDRIVWANWLLRDATEFEVFEKEWDQWFAGEIPVGQATIMPPAHRRAGFRISLGVIAQLESPMPLAAPGDPSQPPAPSAPGDASQPVAGRPAQLTATIPERGSAAQGDPPATASDAEPRAPEATEPS